MRISDWSSYVCSSDLILQIRPYRHHLGRDTGIAQALRYPFTQCLTGTRQQAQLTADLRHAEHALHVDQRRLRQPRLPADRQRVVEGKSVSGRVDLGGRSNLKNNTNSTNYSKQE